VRTELGGLGLVVALLSPWAAPVAAQPAALVTPASGRAFDLSDAPTRGPVDAPVTLVLFSDFQCGFCARSNAVLERVLARYGDDVRLVFKHFPLGFHRDAPLAHRAAIAAHRQGRFQAMHDAIFAGQGRHLSREALIGHATRLGLDLGRFTAGLDDAAAQALVDRDVAEGIRADVAGTPTVFVDGTAIVGAKPYGEFVAVIDAALERARPGAALDRAMSRGPAVAPVTIEWFGDLSSPLHREAVTLVRQVTDAHPGRVRIVFKALPSPTRAHARQLHAAAAAAAEQDRFWDLHDLLAFRIGAAEASTLADYAARLGLARDAFMHSMGTGRGRQKVERDLAEATRRDVRGTPTFFVNGTRVDGLVEPEAFGAIVAGALAR
jgi:protein-disulfide isomerase